LYLLLLEEERPEQRGVCQGGHNRRFLVLKDIPALLRHHDLQTKGEYAAAGDVVVGTELMLVDCENPMLKNDEEW
jgi:hypothetical protein